MRKFIGYITTNFVGCKADFEFEVNDDATEAEIEEAAHEAAFEHVEWSYEEAK